MTDSDDWLREAEGAPTPATRPVSWFCGQATAWSDLDLRCSVESIHGIDPAITGEPSEEQPLRPSRTERVGPSQPAMSGRA